MNESPPTPSQVRQLRARAQHLEPVAFVGRPGLSPAVLESVRTELDRHELIKVKLREHKEHRKTLARTLAERCGAHLVALVGHVIVLFRPHPDPARRRILPGLAPGQGESTSRTR